MAARAFSVPDPISAADLYDAGLLQVGVECVIHPSVRFEPRDRLGTLRPVVLGDRCSVGANSVLHGGVRLVDGVRVEDNVTVGQPEFGYAVRHHYPGVGAPTTIGSAVVLRSHVVVYAGVEIGEITTIGHHTLLRSHVHVGVDCQLAHHLTIERGSWIGDGVRMSPQTHITPDSWIGDHVSIGAGVRTTNSRTMVWRAPERQDELRPPRIEEHAKVGSGCTLLPGVVIGAGALVGAGSLVTRDIPPGVVAYGVPARVRPEQTGSEEAAA